MIVENIILRNVIINRVAAEVDCHISRDDILTITLAGNVIFILLYRTEHSEVLPLLNIPIMVRGDPKGK